MSLQTARSAVVFAILCAASAAAAPSYADLMRTMQSFQEAQVLLTAVELDIFTAVGGGATSSAVAAKLKASPRATETLLNALVAMGALTKVDGVFGNTPDTARYLVMGSPECTRPALMHTVHVSRSWATLSEAVRKGTAVRQPGVDAQDAEWTESFIAAMHRGSAGAAERVVRTVGAAGVRRLLDIGGGSGAYSIAFARANPELRAEVLDLAPVVRIAQKHIDEAGLGARVATRVGDLTRDDFGRGYDLILLSAICHMLGPEENRDLLRRCRRALAPGGRLVIREFILERDKTAPKSAALFAINMLVGTRNGSAYSEDEYREWLGAAGFSTVSRPERGGDLIVAGVR